VTDASGTSSVVTWTLAVTSPLSLGALGNDPYLLLAGAAAALVAIAAVLILLRRRRTAPPAGPGPSGPGTGDPTTPGAEVPPSPEEPVSLSRGNEE
jgi:hypothetical protein